MDASQELSFLTTTSTDIPIKTGGAKSKKIQMQVKITDLGLY